MQIDKKLTLTIIIDSDMIYLFIENSLKCQFVRNTAERLALTLKQILNHSLNKNSKILKLFQRKRSKKKFEIPNKKFWRPSKKNLER